MVTEGERVGVELGIWNKQTHTAICKIDKQQGSTI